MLNTPPQPADTPSLTLLSANLHQHSNASSSTLSSPASSDLASTDGHKKEGAPATTVVGGSGQSIAVVEETVELAVDRHVAAAVASMSTGAALPLSDVLNSPPNHPKTTAEPDIANIVPDEAASSDGSPRSRLNCAINEKAKLSAESNEREARTFAMFEESVRELAIAKSEKAEYEDLVILGVQSACDHVRRVEGSLTELKCTAAEAEAELAQQHSEVLGLLEESEARNASLEMKLFAVQTASPSAEASVEVCCPLLLTTAADMVLSCNEFALCCSCHYWIALSLLACVELHLHYDTISHSYNELRSGC